MGVRGLATYINSNQEIFLKHHLLYDTSLVIDGNSLSCQLYRSFDCFPAFGGEYDRFAACVKKFFRNLEKCNVTSYVIFDGSYENRKLKTAYSRLQSQIKAAARLDPVTQSRLPVFPVLLQDVFKEALMDVKVPYTVCEYEADNEIATMAHQLNCPVLSYDSDFFIYNVLYIPLDSLKYKVIASKENEPNTYALECKIYRVKNLVDNFCGLKEEMMPLFATLLGNDYVHKSMFENFWAQLILPKENSNGSEQQRSIHGLLKWLQNESLDSAVSKIVGRMKKTEKKKVLKIIKSGMKGYNRKNCGSLKFFNLSVEFSEESNLPLLLQDEKGNESFTEDHDNEKEFDDEESSADNVSDEGSSDEINEEGIEHGLPLWIADKIRHNLIPLAYIDLYTHHLDFGWPQAEDYNDDDAFLCVLNILRFAFDILTDYCHEYCLYIGREKGCEYIKIHVGKEYSISRPLNRNFCDLTDEDLHMYFNHFLKEKFPTLDLCNIDLLPPNLCLVMLSILWWVANCNVPKSFIHSLFISFIMLDVIDAKTGTFRGQFYFNRRHCIKLSELKKRPVIPIDCPDMFLNKNNVLYDDCLVAASVLLEHFEISPEIMKRPKTYDIKKIHKFAQFQCCLKQLNCLSTLCGKKYESTAYSKFYNGTFIYNITSKLEKQNDSQLFIEQYLKGANTVIMYFNSLCKVYETFADQLGLVTQPCNTNVIYIKLDELRLSSAIRS